jgi:DNA-directed RNA polymerase subunit RPC12/RpoP
MLDLLIECRGCKIENLFGEYSPDKVLVCNQCRERLVEPDLEEVYSRYDCKNCSFAILVLKETNFKIGEAKCRCGSDELEKTNCIEMVENARNAGAFDLTDEVPPSEDDWYRSEPVQGHDQDYNDMFDRDLGDG